MNVGSMDSSIVRWSAGESFFYIVRMQDDDAQVIVIQALADRALELFVVLDVERLPDPGQPEADYEISLANNCYFHQITIWSLISSSLRCVSLPRAMVRILLTSTFFLTVYPRIGVIDSGYE